MAKDINVKLQIKKKKGNWDAVLYADRSKFEIKQVSFEDGQEFSCREKLLSILIKELRNHDFDS